MAEKYSEILKNPSGRPGEYPEEFEELHPLIGTEWAQDLWDTYWGEDTKWSDPFDVWEHGVASGRSPGQMTDVLGAFGMPESELRSPEYAQAQTAWLGQHPEAGGLTPGKKWSDMPYGEGQWLPTEEDWYSYQRGTHEKYSGSRPLSEGAIESWAGYYGFDYTGLPDMEPGGPPHTVPPGDQGFDYKGEDPNWYWLDRGRKPWDEMGYGVSGSPREAMDAWKAAGAPLPGGYPTEWEALTSEPTPPTPDEPEEPFGPISSCFLPETFIETQNGQKNIKDIKVKDKILTEDGTMVQVVKKFIHRTTNYLVINDSLRVTSNHPILVNNKWIGIGKANIGDKLFSIDGKEITIDSIKPVDVKVTVYNLEVESPHTFFADGILVHNKMAPYPPDDPNYPGEPGGGVITEPGGGYGTGGAPSYDTNVPYYSPDDWQYTQRWGANPPPSREWEELEKGEPYTFQPFVPKTQPPTGVGFEPSQYEAAGVPEYLQKWMTELEQPVETQVGLTEKERQTIYNLGRGQIQGATRTAAEQMRETLGDRGFRAGETGFADTPISQIYQTGQRQMGEFGKEIAISEAQRRFEQQLATQQLGLSRKVAGGGLAAQVAGIEAQERTAGRQLTSTERMFGTQLEWEQSRQGQEFQWQQEKFGEQMRWEQERFGRELSQEERLAQQLIGWEQERFGATMEWDKYRFEEQFGYQQERDVMGDLFDYLGLATQSQLARYQPYWQSWVNTVGA